MKKLMAFAVAVAALVALGGTAARADHIQIQYTGVDLTYDGATLYDTAGGAGFQGSGDPTESTHLTTMVFLTNGLPTAFLGPFSDIFQDFWQDLGPIPDPAPGFSVFVGALGGYNDLLFQPDAGVYPPGGWGLAVDVAMVIEIEHTLTGGYNVFGSGTGTIFYQDLTGFSTPLSDPISVSFSSQISSITTAGGFITGFRTRGTGEHSGNTLIPEPASCVLMGVGLALGAVAYRRRKAA